MKTGEGNHTNTTRRPRKRMRFTQCIESINRICVRICFLHFVYTPPTLDFGVAKVRSGTGCLVFRVTMLLCISEKDLGR
jgi:hypothetical protein